MLGGYLGACVQQKKPIPERQRNRADVWREAEMSHLSPRELRPRGTEPLLKGAPIPNSLSPDVPLVFIP